MHVFTPREAPRRSIHPQASFTFGGRRAAVRSIRAAFAQPGALDRTVHRTIGDIPGRHLLVQLVADCVVHSWDLAESAYAAVQIRRVFARLPPMVDYAM